MSCQPWRWQTVSHKLCVKQLNTHLPRPEEPILQCVHAGHGKCLDASLGGSIPCCRVLPGSTIALERRLYTHSANIKAAIIEAVTKLPCNRYTEIRLTRVYAGTPTTRLLGPDAACTRASAGIDGRCFGAVAKCKVWVSV